MISEKQQIELMHLFTQLHAEIHAIGTLEWGEILVDEVQKPLFTIEKILLQIVSVMNR